MDEYNYEEPTFRRKRTSDFANLPKWLCNRELNVFPRNYCGDDDTKRVLYRNLRPTGRMPSEDDAVRERHGGIFGMDFSPDGSAVVAACENKTLLVIDPLTQKLVRQVDSVHTNCVNAVQFLDSRLFATCSDDHTIKLWDLRFLKEASTVRVLRGHSGWVKNIDYIPADGILLTSGFDHFVYSWKINQYTESVQNEFSRVFYTPGLIRMCLTHDKSKMIISTQWGYLFVVHNFDVNSCGIDLAGFKPNVYWMMMKSANTVQPSFLEANIHRFYAPKNRTELIIDFPKNNDPGNVTSITAHPHGWCVLSRNTNTAETAEWTCVHDIQLPPAEDLLENDDRAASTQATSSLFPQSSDEATSTSNSDQSDEDSPGSDLERHLLNISNQHASIYSHPRLPPPHGGGRRRTIARRTTPPYLTRQQSFGEMLDRVFSVTPRKRTKSSNSMTLDRLLPHTYSRLTHWIEEANVGRGFIKEQSFSSDGRLIASPFGFGVRLLAFDAECSDLAQVSPLRTYERRIWRSSDKTESADENGVSDSNENRQSSSHRRKTFEPEPVPLTEVGMNISHRSSVLCARFSPTHCLLVTGCYHGKVAFHQPVL